MTLNIESDSISIRDLVLDEPAQTEVYPPVWEGLINVSDQRDIASKLETAYLDHVGGNRFNQLAFASSVISPDSVNQYQNDQGTFQAIGPLIRRLEADHKIPELSWLLIYLKSLHPNLTTPKDVNGLRDPEEVKEMDLGYKIELQLNGLIDTQDWPDQELYLRDCQEAMVVMLGLELAYGAEKDKYKVLLEDYLEYSEGNGPEILSKSLDQEINSKNGVRYTSFLATMRLISEEAFQKFPQTPQRWEELTQILNHYRQVGDWISFAKMSAYLKIMLAQKVEIGENGIELTMSKPVSPTFQPESLPERRRF